MPDDPCELCQTTAQTSSSSRSTIDVDCPLCGRYRLILSGYQRRTYDIPFLSILRGWIFDQNALGNPPAISTSTISQLRSMRKPTLVDRMARLLKMMAGMEERLRTPIQIASSRFVAGTYCTDETELLNLAQLLCEKGWLKVQSVSGASPAYQITLEGYVAYEEFLKTVSNSVQGFVAMWFDNNLEEIYENGFSRAIASAGYRPLRVDRVEHAGKIDDEIISQIRRSRFLVADFTGHRGGVYFEAGFAMGLGLPVFFTCRRSELESLHFDVRQYNTIDWEDAGDLSTRLTQRITSVIGDGPDLIGS